MGLKQTDLCINPCFTSKCSSPNHRGLDHRHAVVTCPPGSCYSRMRAGGS